MAVRRKNIVWEWLKADAPLQIFSLIIAFIAWAIVNSGEEAMQKRVLKIQYLEPAEGIVFAKHPLKEVKVDVSGPLYRLKTLKDEDLTYMVDLSMATPGASRIEIEEENVRVPSDIQITHIYPRSFYVYLEDVAVKQLPVKLDIKDRVAEGYQVDSVRIFPEFIQVMGPRSILQKLNAVPLSISIKEKTSSFSERLLPEFSFPGLQTNDHVNIEVQINPERNRIELAQVPVVALQSPFKVRISPSVGKVVLEGKASLLQSLAPRLKLVVPIEGLKYGKYRLRAKLEGLEGLPVKVVSVIPDNFLVEIEGGRP